jgi:hypothetical protein
MFQGERGGGISTYMDDLREDERDEEENYDNDDDDDEEEDESDDGIESKEEEVVDDNEICDRFIRTFSNGYYDKEFDDVLGLDRSVPLPAWPTQASYNKPNNWIDRNQIGLEKVKGQLQNCIDSVMHNESLELYMIHNSIGDQLMDNEEQIVWHEPVLDGYWDQLEDNIWRRQLRSLATKIQRFNIENVEMKKEHLAALVDIFCSGRATNSSTCITFDNANLCKEGIIYLSKLVEASSMLTRLFLDHNRIGNMDSARCLSMSIKSHSSICSLSLAHCDLGSSPEILLVILQTDVHRIILEDNNIDSLGALKIAEHLEGDPPIEVLFLGRNRLNDDDAFLILQAMKRNTNLKGINLHSNNFTSIGVKALLNCVFDSSSLNAISESNHYLERLNIFRFETIESNKNSQQSCIDRLLELDQFQKIVLAVQDKDSLLKYLANVPVKLIPEVLAYPHGRIVDEHKHKHLNIVYSTMRWWNMPLLYSYHNDGCVKSDTKRKREMTV